MTVVGDFREHNTQVRRVWHAYRDGRPERVPVVFGINPRFLLLDPALNREGVTFERYSQDPETMLEIQLRFQEWVRFNVPQDAEMGPPEAWDVYVDFQNYYEAGFLGAEICYPADNVPAARVFLDDDRKNMLLDRGVPDVEKCPLWQRNMEFYEYFRARKRGGFEYAGRPLGTITPKGTGTDGPLTLLMSIRGGGALLDMYTDEDYYRAMMEYLTEFVTDCMVTTRRAAGLPELTGRMDFADDSIELLSRPDYERLVLPYHRMIFERMGAAGPNSMHICGDVQRFLPTIAAELNVNSFDTGFPVNFETLRDEVGEDVEIHGGVHVGVLLGGTAERVRAETRRILESGVTRGGRFVLREANNLPPRTPLENLQAMYEAAKEFGNY